MLQATYKVFCLVVALLAGISVLSGALRVRRDEAFVGYSERSGVYELCNDVEAIDLTRPSVYVLQLGARDN
jgi:hypothetical protein